LIKSRYSIVDDGGSRGAFDAAAWQLKLFADSFSILASLKLWPMDVWGKLVKLKKSQPHWANAIT
jgi:hypothetical protein